MADYRNRPPVDAPRPTPWTILQAAGWRECLAIAACVLGLAASGYMIVVAAGYAWR